jgi:hypothetical protein
MATKKSKKQTKRIRLTIQESGKRLALLGGMAPKMRSIPRRRLQ